MRYFALVALFIAIIMAVSAASIMAAQDDAVVMAVKGNPKIMKKGSSSWTDCRPDMRVVTGDRIMTGSGDEAQISFAENENFIKISEGSDVLILVSPDGGSLDLVNGEAMALINKLGKGSTFEIKTPSGVSGARGTGLGARTNGRNTRFSSYENSIYVRGIDRSGNPIPGELIVNEGFGTSIDQFERPGALERLSGEEMDRWGGWRNSLGDSGHGRGDNSRNRLDRAGNSDDSFRNRLDQAGNNQEVGLEQFESRKQDVNEVRDVNRIEDRQDPVEDRGGTDNTGKTIVGYP